MQLAVIVPTSIPTPLTPLPSPAPEAHVTPITPALSAPVQPILTNNREIVLTMGNISSHPEDQIVGRTLVYTGQERCKKNDNLIPQARTLLYRSDVAAEYRAFHIEFSRQIRVRNEKDPRNLGVVTYRPLYEFRVVGEIPRLVLPAAYTACLENKVLSLLQYGFICEHDTVQRGILPCRRFTQLPSLYDRRMLKWWKKSKLIEKVLQNATL